MSKKILQSQNIYSILWCLYYLQGTLYGEGSYISQGILAVFLLISMYYFFKVYKIPNLPKPIKALNHLVILFGVYGLIRLVVSTSGWKYVNDSTTYFKEYELSILPVYAFYYFSRKQIIGSRWFAKMSILFFITAVLSYYYQEAQALQVSWRSETTNNAGYLIVSLLPIVIFLKRRLTIQYSALLVILYYTTNAMKRGAIVVAAIGLLYFVWETFKKSKGTQKVYITVLGIGIIIAGIVYFQYKVANSEYMQLRLVMTQQGDMSERENMYPIYWGYFIDTFPTLESFIGNGADGTLKLFGDFAHQDWLEITIDEGLLGFFLYLYFWITLILTTLKSRKYNTPNMTAIFALFVIIYFFKSMVSMSINGMTIFSTSALAYALAAMENPKIREDLNNI